MGYIGFRLGLSVEFLKLAGLMGGFFVSFRYSQRVGDWLAGHSFLSAAWALSLAMAILVVGVYFIVTKGLRLVEKVVQVTFEQKVNQIGGLLAGLARGVLTASVILGVVRALPSPYLSALVEERSMSGRFITRVAPAVYESAVPRVSHFMSSVRESAK